AAVTAAPAQSVAFTTLADFDGANGVYSQAGLVLGTDGNFYGTTSQGGNTGCFAFGCGTIFKITPAGTITRLYSLCSKPNCADGASPEAGLVLGTDGAFYGTTSEGGPGGYGTVFKITPSGTLTTLYGFNGGDGAVPRAGLVQASDGNFYGTTSGGNETWGTIFKITPTGFLTGLHYFNFTDGAWPFAGLMQAPDGNLYGTTTSGGRGGSGTVFRITPGGTLTTLYSFCSQPNCADGGAPDAGLVQASDGHFYGTTSEGPPGGYGTVFKITQSGTLTTLYSFNGSDGEAPYAGLVQASDGNFYGTTVLGGADGDGTVFEITPDGVPTTLHTFDGGDGASPYGGLVQAPNGFFYGTTQQGGAHNYGTVYRLGVVRTCATCAP
ncbi:MAG: choice-of-anchor tandem repeat GloVer-containing protein, partial [Candidatus Korobacteraceae bacterium]